MKHLPFSPSPLLPFLGLAVASLLLFARVAATPPEYVEISGFATSLKGRTGSQRHNAMLAARALNGATIQPGAVFSFNRTVKPWSVDEGYVKAPVSYDGELVRAYGGGVCQTSTTLYDAALLAGLPILERHSHVFAAHYAMPGRDAAVAQPSIDLRFRNPYPWPLRIRASAKGDTLNVRLLAPQRPPSRVALESVVLSRSRPQHLTRVVDRPGSNGRAFVRGPGIEGCRVVTYRVFYQGDQELRRERLSDDTYLSMDRIVQLDRD